ncbi:hypothetical protein GCM10023322_75980 [Rugosimonospora acidiphila]|uniref:Glycosyl hydrolase family 32 N-terminal domain-containing protein n=1 Tax=Rugosimonospora acidiphila TaxID=556531 RepID=A0ABP9SPU2_9ACTN
MPVPVSRTRPAPRVRMRLAAALVAVVTAVSGAPAAAGAHPAPAPAGDVTVTDFSTTSHVVAAGTFTNIYDPSVGETSPWYINDHTIIRGPDGTWHLFGITHQEPANPDNEVNFAHATAPSLHGPWTKQPFALAVDPSYGESHLWAPHVIASGGLYYMFYAGGGPDHAQSEISLAISPDLWHWTRYNGDPLLRDGFDARDPYITRIGKQWVMYYDATSQPAGGNHVVAYRTSTDLLHWSASKFAFTDPSTGTSGGPTESPFVVHYRNYYYLFIGPRGGYVGTDVFRSRDPLHFDASELVGHIASHALEVVQDTDGSWWVTSAGWGQGGVWLAPLDWSRPVVTAGYRISTPSYRATVQTSPSAALTSMQVPIGGSWRELLDAQFRGTLPYAGIGGFGATDPPGAAATVSTSADRRTITLSGIPVGSQPVTVDWRLQAATGWLDQSFTWHVTGAVHAPAWEVGWSLDTTLPQVGDNLTAARSGDAAGFPEWTLASDSTVSLVAAYRQGSAWATTNRWYDPADGAISWQPLWANGGTAWPPGDYPGGTWRLGVSPHPADTAFADALYGGLNAIG